MYVARQAVMIVLMLDGVLPVVSLSLKQDGSVLIVRLKKRDDSKH
jgi:hypothetical protein